MSNSRWQYFTVEELSCHCGQCEYGPDQMAPELMTKLVAIRRHLGFPIPLSSSIRCPEHNAAVSTTGLNGPHTTGKAVDTRLSGKKAVKFTKACFDFGLITEDRGGLGVSQKGDHGKRFLHVDILKDSETPGPRPWVWSY